MILILSPLPVLSQKVTTNLINETVTLDKEKAIDVASIIENEKRLRLVNAELLETIRKQDSVIRSITDRNITGLRTIEAQSNHITSLSGSIQELAEGQLKLEESRNSMGRLYFNVGYEFSNPYFKSGNIGLTYFTKRFTFGATLNPLNDKVIWGGVLGVKLL